MSTSGKGQEEKGGVDGKVHRQWRRRLSMHQDTHARWQRYCREIVAPYLLNAFPARLECEWLEADPVKGVGVIRRGVVTGHNIFEGRCGLVILQRTDIDPSQAPTTYCTVEPINIINTMLRLTGASREGGE